MKVMFLLKYYSTIYKQMSFYNSLPIPPRPTQKIIIRFLEAEATVEGIAAKVREALESEEDINLIDSQGNEVLDSEGTRGSHYWKQNSRKIFALLENDFREFQNGRRAKTSRRAEESHLQELIDKIEQLKDADSINQLSEMAKSKVKESDIQPAKEAFSCLVCKAAMDEPTFSGCCCSLVGCGTFVR